MKHHANVRPHQLQDDAVQKLNVTYPVAIRNACSDSSEIKLCSIGPTIHTGNLCEFTDVATDIVKSVFEKQDIKTDSNADKVLELSFKKAHCSQLSGAAVVILNVKTGNGLEKEYKAKATIIIGHVTTTIFEKVIANCVAQMLNDPDVIRYLES